ncbi:hypothetical protein LCGC14_0250010 [marine sediment metagenome]|uniref:HNH nuclease domain-containing protein n=1 Tax=marine sediment metagenome TaxID=412755 RepID=A0A0F9X9Z1_9ZZZZ
MDTTYFDELQKQADEQDRYYGELEELAEKSIRCLHKALDIASKARGKNEGSLMLLMELEQWRSINTPPKLKKRRPLKRSEKTAIFERDKHRCVQCGDWKKLQIDHIVPISKNGTNHADNLQTPCQTCNSNKGAK